MPICLVFEPEFLHLNNGSEDPALPKGAVRNRMVFRVGRARQHGRFGTGGSANPSPKGVMPNSGMWAEYSQGTSSPPQPRASRSTRPDGEGKEHAVSLTDRLYPSYAPSVSCRFTSGLGTLIECMFEGQVRVSWRTKVKSPQRERARALGTC